MEIENFVAPSYLDGYSLEQIHASMLEKIQENVPNLDVSEGSLAWDFTRPTAWEAARMINFNIIESIKNMFPMWAYGENLDRLATIRGLERKAATGSTGTVTITGSVLTVVPKGSIFCTDGSKGSERILFETTEEVIIPNNNQITNSVSVGVSSVDTGEKTNVASNTIIKSYSASTALLTVTNSAATTGGTDEESDDDLRERLVEADRSNAYTNVGSPADYKRWAKEVDGVGEAFVTSATNNDGTVTIKIMDTSGAAASTTLCTQVNNYIMSPSDEQKRLAPINARLSVLPATVANIYYTATITLEDDITLATVKTQFVSELQDYYLKAVDNGVARKAEIAAILIDIPGVADYSSFTMNSAGVTGNITLSSGTIPYTSESFVTLTDASASS